MKNKGRIIFILFCVTMVCFTGCTSRSGIDLGNYANTDNSDVSVVRAWIPENEISRLYISLFNNTIYATEYFELGVLLFDEDGKPVATNKNYEGIDASNMLLLRKNRLAIQPQSVSYDAFDWRLSVDAAYARVYIKTIAYSNHTKWENKDFQAQMNTGWTEFDLNEGRKDTEVISNSQIAINSSPIYINEVVNQQTQSRSMCSIIFKNNDMQRIIKRVEFVVLMFDKDNKPVSCKVQREKFLTDNGQRLSVKDLNVTMGKETGTGFYWQLEPECKYVKACPLTVEFIDGTVWNNAYLGEWVVMERDSYVTIH